jgi:hypothetical protein
MQVDLPAIQGPTPILRPPGPADEMFESLRDHHTQLVFEARAEGGGAESLPAWFLHFASGKTMRVKFISTLGPLLRFVDAEETTALIAPDAVSLTIEPIPPESDGSSFQIGFVPPAECSST